MPDAADRLRGPTIAALTTELVGTFFLVLAIGLSVLGTGGAPVALVVGVVLLAIVYSGGPVSRAMYNPAVSLGFVLRGVLRWRELPGFVGVQLAGSLLAVGATLVILPRPSVPATAMAGGPALLAELIFTFALMWVILHVADMAGAEGNAWYGLAIAGVVVTAILTVGDVSGSVLNPAVALAGGLLGIFAWADVALYVPTQLAGAALAVVVARASAPRPLTQGASAVEGR